MGVEGASSHVREWLRSWFWVGLVASILSLLGIAISGKSWELGPVILTWITVLVIVGLVGAVIQIGEAVTDRRTARFDAEREAVAARPIDRDVVEFRTVTASDLARLRTRHRWRARLQAVLVVVLAPFAALLAWVAVAESWSYLNAREVGWNWLANIAMVLATGAAIVTFGAAFVLIARLLMLKPFVVIGQVRDRTMVPANGLMIATEWEHHALSVDVQQCYRLGSRGRLEPTPRWTGTQEFPGPTELVNVVPDGQVVVLLCRQDGRILDRFSELVI